jgi:hypothetical protein
LQLKAEEGKPAVQALLDPPISPHSNSAIDIVWYTGFQPSIFLARGSKYIQSRIVVCSQLVEHQPAYPTDKGFHDVNNWEA